MEINFPLPILYKTVSPIISLVAIPFLQIFKHNKKTAISASFKKSYNLEQFRLYTF